MARQGARRSPSMSAPPCEDAEAPPGAPPEHLSMPGLICGRLHSASPTVVNGTCCAGLRFPGRRLRAGLNGRTPQPAPGRRLVVAAGRGTARGPGAWEARSSPARGRRILLHHQTPLDDAPRLSRTDRIIVLLRLKSSARKNGDGWKPPPNSPLSLKILSLLF
jgi:hypothetical protein